MFTIYIVIHSLQGDDLHCTTNPCYEITQDLLCNTNPSYDVVSTTKDATIVKHDVYYETIQPLQQVPSESSDNTPSYYDVIK